MPTAGRTAETLVCANFNRFSTFFLCNTTPHIEHTQNTRTHPHILHTHADFPFRFMRETFRPISNTMMMLRTTRNCRHYFRLCVCVVTHLNTNLLQFTHHNSIPPNQSTNHPTRPTRPRTMHTSFAKKNTRVRNPTNTHNKNQRRNQKKPFV